MKESTLLQIDGYGNILLALPLLFYPTILSQLFGIEFASNAFYPTILGAIFLGIGIALLLERYRSNLKGLGVGGALTINLTFGIILGFWLIKNSHSLSYSGNLILWLLVLILIGISTLEWFSLSSRSS